VKQLENSGLLDEINGVDVGGGSSQLFLFSEHDPQHDGGHW
jgi:hypothetical protein